MRTGARLWTVSVAALAAMPAVAMVPVHFQRQSELRAVLDLPGLAPTLREPIERVERVAPDVWRVSGGRCHIDVRMVPPHAIGPGLTPPRFEPQPGRRVCG